MAAYTVARGRDGFVWFESWNSSTATAYDFRDQRDATVEEAALMDRCVQNAETHEDRETLRSMLNPSRIGAAPSTRIESKE